MTNEQAEELARTLWGERGLARRASCDGPRIVMYGVGAGGVHAEGMSWEEAFIRAGVAAEVVAAELVRDHHRRTAHIRYWSVRQPMTSQGLAFKLLAEYLGIQKNTLEVQASRRAKGPTRRLLNLPVEPAPSAAPSPPHEG